MHNQIPIQLTFGNNQEDYLNETELFKFFRFSVKIFEFLVDLPIKIDHYSLTGTRIYSNVTNDDDIESNSTKVTISKIKKSLIL